MINLFQNGSQIQYGVKKYIVDDATDLESVSADCVPGSLVFVIANSETYMLNGNHEWTKVEIGSGGGGGAVNSVNGKTGDVILYGEDIGIFSITPLSFGAIGDGSTDDTEALFNTFNHSNIIIDGYNKEYKFLNVEIIEQHDVVIKNFIFKKGINLKLRGCKNILFENCIFDEFFDNNIENAGVAAVTLASKYNVLNADNDWGLDGISENITFDKCTFSNIWYSEHLTSTTKPHYSTGMAIKNEGIDGLTVMNCKFTQIKGNACIYVNTHGWIGDFDFHDNLFYLNGWAGIEFYRCNVIKPNKRRIIHNNRFIGCGLGYIPQEYFDTYYSSPSDANKTGVGTAAIIGLNYPLFHDVSYNADTNRCSLMCAVENNIFIDNNESSVEGSAWTPVINNYIVGVGAFQTELNRIECINKYNIDYYTRIRLNPSCVAFYSSGREHNERDEPFIIRNNTVSRLEGTSGVKNPMMIQGTRKKPFVFEGNEILTLPSDDKWALINKSDFQAGFKWKDNTGLPPYFNSCNIRKNYYMDDIKDLYNCTYEEDAYIEVPNTERFPQAQMSNYDSKICDIRNDECAIINKNLVELKYIIKDPVVEPFGTPVYSIDQQEQYDQELGGLVFDGTNGFDTGIKLFDQNQDFTIIVKYKFDNICNHGSGSLIKYPKFTYFPVVSCMNYQDSKNLYPGFDLGLMFDGTSDYAFGGYQRFRNHWGFSNSVQMSSSLDYSVFYTKTYSYIIVKRNGVLYCYDSNPLSKKISVSGKAAATQFDGTLCIGKNLMPPTKDGQPWKTNEQFKGIVYQCDVYDHAISTASLEAVYPTLEDTEASLKGAITMWLDNKNYAKHTIRAIGVDICYDLIGSENSGDEAFQVRLMRNVNGSINIPDDQSVHHIKKIIPVQRYADTIQPYDRYPIQIINTSKKENLIIRIKNVKLTALTKAVSVSDEDIKVDDFDIIWDKNIENMAIGEKIAGQAIFYPSDAVTYNNFNVKVEDESVATVTYGTKGFEVTSLIEGETLCTISYGDIEKQFNIIVIDQPVYCTNLTVTPAEQTIFINKNCILTAHREPINCNQNVYWESDNNSICTVEDGLVLGLSSGTCTITATCGDRIATSEITVIEEVKPLDSSYDITSFVGYLPVNDISKDHTVLIELDKDNWDKTNITENKTVISTKSGADRDGLGLLTMTIQKDSNGNIFARDYFEKDATEITAPLSNANRKQLNNHINFDSIIFNKDMCIHRGIQEGRWVDAGSTWTTSVGIVPKFNKALYFNTDGTGIDINGLTETEIKNMIDNTQLIPSLANKNLYIKNYLVFNENIIPDSITEYSEKYDYLIQNRDKAIIDIRLGDDNKIHNFGKENDIIGTSLQI